MRVKVKKRQDTGFVGLRSVHLQANLNESSQPKPELNELHSQLIDLVVYLSSLPDGKAWSQKDIIIAALQLLYNQYTTNANV